VAAGVVSSGLFGQRRFCGALPQFRDGPKHGSKYATQSKIGRQFAPGAGLRPSVLRADRAHLDLCVRDDRPLASTAVPFFY
jgi:hypothetical protein